jgi:dihydroneopterin aldolase
MITIAVHGAEFFAYHGFYPEEQQLGCKFIVDAEVSFEPAADLTKDELSDTANYEDIYAVICTQMRHTRKLIEAVAQGIVNDIRAKFPYLVMVKVTLKKMNPPLGGRVDHSGVTITG